VLYPPSGATTEPFLLRLVILQFTTMAILERSVSTIGTLILTRQGNLFCAPKMTNAHVQMRPVRVHWCDQRACANTNLLTRACTDAEIRRRSLYLTQ